MMSHGTCRVRFSDGADVSLQYLNPSGVLGGNALVLDEKH